MKLLSIIILAALVASTAGCGAPQITFDQGKAALAYADVKGLYERVKVFIEIACAKGKLDAPTCEELKQADMRMKLVEEVIRAQIGNPNVPVDWDKIIAVALQAVGIATRAGLLGL